MLVCIVQLLRTLFEHFNLGGSGIFDVIQWCSDQVPDLNDLDPAASGNETYRQTRDDRCEN